MSSCTRCGAAGGTEWNNAAADKSFRALQGGSGLLGAPILQTLILNRSPTVVRAWADAVAAWDFDKLVPCHLAAPIAATPRSFRAAFDFLDPAPVAPAGPAAAALAACRAALRGLSHGGRPRPVIADFAALEGAEVGLMRDGSLFPRGDR